MWKLLGKVEITYVFQLIERFWCDRCSIWCCLLSFLSWLCIQVYIGNTIQHVKRRIWVIIGLQFLIWTLIIVLLWGIVLRIRFMSLILRMCVFLTEKGRFLKCCILPRILRIVWMWKWIQCMFQIGCSTPVRNFQKSGRIFFFLKTVIILKFYAKNSVDVWGCLSSSMIVLKKWILTWMINWQRYSYKMINVGLADFK
jgi:hypothetical protein